MAVTLRHAACPWCHRGQTFMGRETECQHCERPIRVAFIAHADVEVLRAVPAPTRNPWPEVAPA